MLEELLYDGGGIEGADEHGGVGRYVHEVEEELHARLIRLIGRIKLLK